MVVIEGMGGGGWGWGGSDGIISFVCVCVYIFIHLVHKILDHLGNVLGCKLSGGRVKSRQQVNESPHQRKKLY